MPYTKYSIAYIIKVLTLRHINGQSIYQLQDYLSSFETEEEPYRQLEAGYLYYFKEMVLESINKMLASGYYPEMERELSMPSSQERIGRFIKMAEDFECFKAKTSIRGPCGLSYDYYLAGGGCFSNSYFLFGTPSQFR